jgi:hypothetical protein
MPDVSGPGGSTPSAHQNLPATAGLDGFEYRTVAEAGLEHESAEASLLAALAAVLPDQVPTAQRGLVSGVLGVCVPIASVSGPFLVQLFTGNRLAMFLAPCAIGGSFILLFAVGLKDRRLAKADRPTWSLREFASIVVAVNGTGGIVESGGAAC